MERYKTGRIQNEDYYKQNSAAPANSRIAKTIIKTIDFFLDLFVIFVVLILTGFGAYSIWDTNQIYTAVDTTQYETYKPAADEDDSTSLQELQAINPDVLGWITIYGTGVDYPLLQGEDNSEYMNKTATGNFALGGSIFLSTNNKPDFSDFNNIIYGHHMEQSQMFGDIDRFDNSAYFESHRYGNLYYSGSNHGLDMFAMVDADAYDFTLYAEKVTDKDEYLSYIKSIARYWRDESLPMAAEHIVMLSTCSDAETNGRYVLFGIITDRTYQDTFQKEETIVARTLNAVSTNKTIVPTLIIIIVIIIIALVLAIVLRIAHVQKKRKERKKRRQGKEKTPRRRN